MEYVSPQVTIQPPDIYGAYLRGQMGPMQLQSAHLGIEQQQQDLQHGQLNMEQLRTVLQNQKTIQNFYGSQLQPGGSGGNGSDAQNGPQNGSQGSYSGGNGVNPVTYAERQRAITGLVTGDPEKAQAAYDASIKGASETDTYRQNHIKLDTQPTLDLIDTFRASAHPAANVAANPSILAKWPEYAQRLGITIDPSAPFARLTDDNARQALDLAGNMLRGQRGEAAQTSAAPLQTKGLQQIDPITGKIVREEDTANVVGPDGQPTIVPKSQSVGKTPYNATTFVDSGAIAPQAEAIASYRQPTPTGFFLKTAQGQELMRQVYALNPAYDATQYAAKQAGYTKFTSGKQGDTVRSLSVATSHLDTLGQMVDALNNGDVRALNMIGNRWAQETGGAAPTNFDTVKNIVADEVTKAVIGYGGSAGDRDKAAAVIDRQNSPQQLKGAIQTYEQLMGGQLQGLKRQYETATGRDDFESMLSPEARDKLGAQPKGSAPQAAIDYLKGHPELKDQFRAKYGYLPQ